MASNLCRSNRPALIAPGRTTITFAHLADHVDRTMLRLRELGVRRHDLIAAVLPDAPDSATAALACSALARFAPLASNLTRACYDAIFFDLTPALVLVPAAAPHPARDAARALDISVVEVVSHQDAGEFTLTGRGSKPVAASDAAPEDVALIFSLPDRKFAPLTHANLLAAIENIPLELGNTLHPAPLHEWRGLVEHVFAPLAAGLSVAFCGTARSARPGHAEAPPIACNEIAVVEGELAARGPAVIPAYFRNHAATRDAFRDGWFFLTGRAQNIRSGRVEISPLEIDEALLSHPDVAQAVSFPVPDSKFGESIAAAVVLRSGTSTGSLELKRFVSTHLARHKVPRQIVVLDTIPRVARNALARALQIEPPLHPAEIFPIRAEAVGTPVFLIDPENAAMSIAEGPVFGIRLPEMAELPPPHTVEHVAAECVHALRRFQPEGPYAIGGSESSGTIALEIARQLEQTGEEVNFVATFPSRRQSRLGLFLGRLLGRQQTLRHDRVRAQTLPARIAVVK